MRDVVPVLGVLLVCFGVTSGAYTSFYSHTQSKVTQRDGSEVIFLLFTLLKKIEKVKKDKKK